MERLMKPESILVFWFKELDPEQWFKKDLSLDSHIKERFADFHTAAAAGELYGWRKTVHGRLAEIIVLDQFSRNIYRDEPGAFACDPMALALAQEAVTHGLDGKLPKPTEKLFLYIPYMHSESEMMHDIALDLFDQPGLESNHAFEIKHKQIIDRFGRYPHRNDILGRVSTPDEIAFLKEPNSSF
tara:strand:+ start:9364 stop:9918 length:555 start_codon:yes stop_codon:yes gene_type:complete